MSTYTNIDIKSSVNKKDIVILPLKNDSITPLGYDITIGKIITISEGAKISEKDGRITIPPKSLNIVVAKEFIWVSRRIIGTLHSRGTLAAKGILTNSTNVDPNFGGQMVMSLYNSSDRSITLDKEEQYITLIFHSVLTPTDRGPGEKKTARVLDTLAQEYGNDEIQKLITYMNSCNTKYWEEFTNLIVECKKRGPIKIIKNYFLELKENHGSKAFKLITDSIFIICLLFLAYNLGQVIYYKIIGNDAALATEKSNLYVLMAAFLAIGIYNKKK